MLIIKYNRVFYGHDEPYFVCTHSASAGDHHLIKHTGTWYMYRGHRGNIGSKAFPLHFSLADHFNIMHCGQGITCSTRHPFQVYLVQTGESIYC